MAYDIATTQNAIAHGLFDLLRTIPAPMFSGLAILVSALINGLAILIINVWQQARENRLWQREKLYELFSNTDRVFTDLVKASSTRDLNNATLSYYSLLCALSRLALACPEKTASELKAIEEGLKPYLVSSLFQGAESEFLQEQRRKVISLAQSDDRLKELFNV